MIEEASREDENLYRLVKIYGWGDLVWMDNPSDPIRGYSADYIRFKSPEDAEQFLTNKKRLLMRVHANHFEKNPTSITKLSETVYAFCYKHGRHTDLLLYELVQNPHNRILWTWTPDKED